MTKAAEEKSELATGRVVRAFGNLLQVQFQGSIKQGEIAMVEVEDSQLKAEVIEINHDVAKSRFTKTLEA